MPYGFLTAGSKNDSKPQCPPVVPAPYLFVPAAFGVSRPLANGIGKAIEITGSIADIREEKVEGPPAADIPKETVKIGRNIPIWESGRYRSPPLDRLGRGKGPRKRRRPLYL